MSAVWCFALSCSRETLLTGPTPDLRSILYAFKGSWGDGLKHHFVRFQSQINETGAFLRTWTLAARKRLQNVSGGRKEDT